MYEEKIRTWLNEHRMNGVQLLQKLVQEPSKKGARRKCTSHSGREVQTTWSRNRSLGNRG